MTASVRTFALISVLAGVLVVFAVIGWTATLDKCATVDEPTLVDAWIQWQYRDFRVDCENPPLLKYAMAIGLPADLFHIDRQSAQWQSLLQNADALAPICSQALYHTPGVDADALLRKLRGRMVLIAVLLGAGVAWWAWRLGGAVAAIVALAAFSFDPNFLAHSPLVKNDVPLAMSLLLLAAAIWMFGRRASALRLLLVCSLLGVAFMTKFSGIIGLAALAAALLIRSFIPIPWRIEMFTASTVWNRLAVSAGAVVVAGLFLWLFTWASYDFRFLPTPGSADQFDLQTTLRDYANHEAFAQSADPFHLDAAALTKYWQHWRAPLSIRALLWASEHRLLPQSCIAGLLRTDAASQSRVTFLCGRSSVTGWWYYFPAVMLFKTPVATLLGIVAACAIMLPGMRRLSAGAAWDLAALAILPALYLLMAMCSNVDVGIRHILPIYPFIFIFLGIAAARAWNSGHRRAQLIICLLAVGLVAETAAAFPNFIPFFNAPSGGRRGGLRLLSESNLDWGQDLLSAVLGQRRSALLRDSLRESTRKHRPAGPECAGAGPTGVCAERRGADQSVCARAAEGIV
jgi:hypothetical protein